MLLGHVSTAYSALQEEAGMAIGFIWACALRRGLTHTGAVGSAF